ncbi:MAG: 4'-phosphopantetheinyl transferase superfamily protein [Pseudomonadota bacterium]
MNVDVDLWSWPLYAGDESANGLRSLLSDDERMRAEKIKNDAARRNFILARARIRQILARHVCCDASQLQFVYGPNGKPALKNCDLHFNLSHTSGWAVMAVTQDCSVGADIEELRPVTQDLARRFFSTAEHAALTGLGPSEWTDAFFSIWTAKEAISKALGLGLTLDFSSFDVDSNAHTQMVLVPTAAGQAVHLSYRRFPCRPQIHGCVAIVADRPIALHHHAWEEVAW